MFSLGKTVMWSNRIKGAIARENFLKVLVVHRTVDLHLAT